jgi:hypothetical protein
MKTFSTPLELSEFAFANLQLKLKIKKPLTQDVKISRALLDVILKEEKKNKNRQLAIAKLLYLLRFVTIKEQVLKVYHVLALRVSQCDESDVEFLDFIIYKGSGEFLNHTMMEVIFAMCAVAKHKVVPVPKEIIQGLFERFSLLKSMGLSFYFEPPVFSLHNQRCKQESIRVSVA